MPDFTANFALPYPSSVDEPCDFAEQWCDFTDAVEGVLDAVQASVDRIYPVIRVSILRLSEVTTFAGGAGTPIVYDTVDIDTPGWVDTVSMDRIVPDIGGFIGATTHVNFVGKAVDQFQVDLRTGDSTLVNDVNVFTTAAAALMGTYYSTESYSMSAFDYTNGFFHTRIDDTSADTPMSVNWATMSVYWHSDV